MVDDSATSVPPTTTREASITSSTTMGPRAASSPATLPLTLILAATPKLGIGRNGGLPWPALKTEMGWFARVTKRVAPENQNQTQGSRVRVNAVIMGRKTWDSIPEKFRPLKGRLNVVVTRDVDGLGRRIQVAGKEGQTGAERSVEGPLVVGSLEGALETLQRLSRSSTSSTSRQGEAAASTSSEPDAHTSSESSEIPFATNLLPNLEISRIFVIGGSSLYASALHLPQTDRVLLTKIHNEYECDTFFPIDLDGEEGRREGWVKKGRKELEEWVGEELDGGKDGAGRLEEKGVGFEFVMFERAR